MCVNNLPTVALNSRSAGIRTHDPSLAFYHYATKPHRKTGRLNKKAKKSLGRLLCVHDKETVVRVRTCQQKFNVAESEILKEQRDPAASQQCVQIQRQHDDYV